MICESKMPYFYFPAHFLMFSFLIWITPGDTYHYTAGVLTGKKKKKKHAFIDQKSKTLKHECMKWLIYMTACSKKQFGDYQLLQYLRNLLCNLTEIKVE